MKTTAAVLTLAVLAAAPAAAQAPKGDTVPAVQALLDAQVAAWNRGDLEAFMAGYWRSPELVFCSGATLTKGWDATLERYRRRYQAEGREMGRLGFDAVEITQLGPDAAYARGAYRLRMRDGSEPHGLFTIVLRRFAEGFRIVHDHTSAAE